MGFGRALLAIDSRKHNGTLQRDLLYVGWKFCSKNISGRWHVSRRGCAARVNFVGYSHSVKVVFNS